MATAFTKQETVFFDELLAGFDDRLKFAKSCSVFNADPTLLERSQGTAIWRPVPYISRSIDGAAGTDISANFADVTQLSVPISLGYDKTVPWTMTINDLNDQMQRERKMRSAQQKLASDINKAIADTVGVQGTLVVKRTSAASGYDDIGLANALMEEQGIVDEASMRSIFIHTRDYINMAGAFAKPQTSANPKVNKALEDGYLGAIAGFETHSAEYTYRLTAAAGTTVTVNGANQYYTPKATSTATTGETANVDNRAQNLTVAVTSGAIKVGDRFTIAGVNAVNHITKVDTGQLKTFTVKAIVSGAGGSGVISISPPIISGGGSTQAELEYRNVTATPASNAAITWLNTAACNVAPFWDERAIELLPGRNGFDDSMRQAGAGMMTATTDVGVQIAMYKFFDINTKKFKYRCDTRFGVGLTNPEMAGVILFSQS